MAPSSAARLLMLVLVLLATPVTGGAQGSAEQRRLVQRYGGVLAANCADYTAPQLLFPGDALVVRSGGRAVLTARPVQEAPGYFGGSPPPEYETALIGELPGGERLVFVFFRTGAGLFASVEADGARAASLLPPALRGGVRVRHCDPNRHDVPGASGGAAPPGAAAAGPVGPTALLRDPRFRSAYQQALGTLAQQPWLARLDGPAPPLRTVRAAGQEWQLAAVCKPHDCADHNAVLLWSPASQTVTGLVFQQGRHTLLGLPPAPLRAELQRLWQAEWRSGR